MAYLLECSYLYESLFAENMLTTMLQLQFVCDLIAAEILADQNVAIIFSW
jgi:hypothetical protein